MSIYSFSFYAKLTVKCISDTRNKNNAHFESGKGLHVLAKQCACLSVYIQVLNTFESIIIPFIACSAAVSVSLAYKQVHIYLIIIFAFLMKSFTESFTF